MARTLEQQNTDGAAELQMRIERRKRKMDTENCNALAMRWQDNRGEAVTSVPLLPPDLWAHILQQGRDERAQLEEWVAWANRKLLQLVVVWFRTGGQRDSGWLGRLVTKSGGITTRDTDNIAKRFTPWCRAILQPGSQNEPHHYEGDGAAPANFVNVHRHMLSMMGRQTQSLPTWVDRGRPGPIALNCLQGAGSRRVSIRDRSVASTYLRCPHSYLCEHVSRHANTWTVAPCTSMRCCSTLPETPRTTVVLRSTTAAWWQP